MPKYLLVLLLIAAGGAVAAGFALGWFSPAPAGNDYNVVLISIDSLRQDRVGIYGHKPEFAPEIPVSPNLDSLAADGALFDSAWSTTSWTLPSHMALMTGLTDRGHGVIMDEFRLDPRRETLAEQFERAGYATGGYFSGPYLNGKYGFARGFGDYRSAMNQTRFIETVQRVNEELRAQGKPELTKAQQDQLWDSQSHEDVTSPVLNRFAQEFLEEHAGKQRFFLFLHYFDVHYDHIPPPELAKAFDPDYTGSMTGADWFSNPKVRNRKTGKRVINERDLHHVMALYDAELNMVDQYIGRVFQMLKDAGVWDKTIVAIVSDHGDEFFEHGSIGHRSTLYTELTRIPMILRVPGQTEAGQRVPELVRLYDVAPTLLDYAELGSLEDAEGTSLRPLIEPAAAGGPPRHQLGRIAWYKPGGYEYANVRDCWRNERFTISRRLGLRQVDGNGPALQVLQVHRSDTRLPWIEVFDREEDPGEHRALAPTDPRYREALRAFCTDYRANEEHWSEMSHSDLDELYVAAESALEQKVNQAQLEELGYAGQDVDVDELEGERLPPLGPFPNPCGQ